MANVTHNTLTGAELHEPKGCADATSKAVYVSNGSGSGAWGFDPYTQLVTVYIPGSTTVGSNAAADWLFTHYVYVPWPSTLSMMAYSYATLPAVAGSSDVNNVITLYNNAGTTVTGGSVGVSGSDGKGTVTCTANNTFSTGHWCKITRSVSGATDDVFWWNLVLHFNRTAT